MKKTALLFLLTALGCQPPIQERTVVMPGLDPADRTIRNAPTWTSLTGPGLQPGQTAEWRSQLGVFGNPANPLTRNTVHAFGWNMAPGAPVDHKKPTLGMSFENGYQPSGYSPVETWGEFHLVYGGIGRNPRRPISMAGVAETGKVGIVIQGDRGGFSHEDAAGKSTQLLTWHGPDAVSQNVKFRIGQNNVTATEQLNSAGRAFVRLPYLNDRDEVVAGHDPVKNRTATIRTRGLVLEELRPDEVTTPANGCVTVFVDAGQLKMKRPDGSIVTVR